MKNLYKKLTSNNESIILLMMSVMILFIMNSYSFRSSIDIYEWDISIDNEFLYPFLIILLTIITMISLIDNHHSMYLKIGRIMFPLAIYRLLIFLEYYMGVGVILMMITITFIGIYIFYAMALKHYQIFRILDTIIAIISATILIPFSLYKVLTIFVLIFL